MEITIRRFEPRDLPAVLSVERLSFPHPWEATDAEGVLSTPHTACFVAMARNTLVGYIFFRSRTVEYGEVVSFAVHPEFRETGIGTALVGCVLNRLKPGQYVLSDVWERNTRALVFLRERGFRFDGIVRHPYAENDDDAIRVRFTMPPPIPGPGPLSRQVSLALPR